MHSCITPHMIIQRGAEPRVAGVWVQTKDGMKMGKSLGNVLEPRRLLAAYGSDAVRFYFLKEVPFGQVRPIPERPTLPVLSPESAASDPLCTPPRCAVGLCGSTLSTSCRSTAAFHFPARPGTAACRRAQITGGSAITGGVCLEQDGDFSEQRFRDIVNAFLANSVGNLLNRTLGLLRKNCSGALPAAAAAVPADHPLRAVAELEARGRHRKKHVSMPVIG